MPRHAFCPLPPAICIMYAILSVQQQQRLERVANLSLMCCVRCPWGQVGVRETVVIAVVIVVADAQVEGGEGAEGAGAGKWGLGKRQLPTKSSHN